MKIYSDITRQTSYGVEEIFKISNMMNQTVAYEQTNSFIKKENRLKSIETRTNYETYL